MVMEDIRLVSSHFKQRITTYPCMYNTIWNPLVVHILIWVRITGLTDISWLMHKTQKRTTRRNQNSNTIFFFGLFFIPNNAVSLDWMVFSCFFHVPFPKSKPLPTAIGPLFRMSVKISNRFIWIWWFNKKRKKYKRNLKMELQKRRFFAYSLCLSLSTSSNSRWIISWIDFIGHSWLLCAIFH